MHKHKSNRLILLFLTLIFLLGGLCACQSTDVEISGKYNSSVGGYYKDYYTIIFTPSETDKNTGTYESVQDFSAIEELKLDWTITSTGIWKFEEGILTLYDDLFAGLQEEMESLNEQIVNNGGEPEEIDEYVGESYLYYDGYLALQEQFLSGDIPSKDFFEAVCIGNDSDGNEERIVFSADGTVKKITETDIDSGNYEREKDIVVCNYGSLLASTTYLIGDGWICSEFFYPAEA